MKLIKTSIVLFTSLVFVSASANAASIVVARGIGNPGVDVFDFSDTALTSGGFYMAVGSFTVIPTITDYTSMITALGSFNTFAQGTSSTLVATAGKIQGAANFVSDGGATPSLWNSQEVFVIIGNAATFGASTDFAIIRGAAPVLFPADVSLAGSTTFSTATGASIQVLGAAGSISGNSLTLLGVPEPSVALLGAFGVLGLLRRRR